MNDYTDVLKDQFGRLRAAAVPPKGMVRAVEELEVLVERALLQSDAVAFRNESGGRRAMLFVVVALVVYLEPSAQLVCPLLYPRTEAPPRLTMWGVVTSRFQ